MTLSGRTAFVTGASRGIGRAIALELGRHGAAVVGTATGEAGAGAIRDFLREAGISGTGIVMDVNHADQVEAAVTSAQQDFGDIAVLVNNAGITRDSLLLRLKEDDWDAVMATDLKSVYRLCRQVLRGMMKLRFGRIINVTSVIGATGNAGQTSYAAAKAGVVGFSKSLAREIGSRSVTVNCVAPGFIETDMTATLTQTQRSALLQTIPLGRLGRVEDVAAAVAFLASPAAEYITGATLHVNGGMHMD